MNKFIKIAKVMMLTLSLIITSSLGGSLSRVNANEKENITNFVIHSGDDLKNVVYTYSENGKDYKVVEKSSDDFKRVDSSIYIKDENGNYLLEESRVFQIDGNNATNIVTNADTKEVEVDEIQISDFMTAVDDNKQKSNLPGDGGGGWSYHHTMKSSTKVNAYTLTVVTNMLIAGFGYAWGGPIGAAVTSGLQSTAGFIITESIPHVYYTHKYYYSFKPGTNLVQGEKKFMYTYKDSSRTKQVGPTVSQVYWL